MTAQKVQKLKTEFEKYDSNNQDSNEYIANNNISYNEEKFLVRLDSPH